MKKTVLKHFENFKQLTELLEFDLKTCKRKINPQEEDYLNFMLELINRLDAGENVTLFGDHPRPDYIFYNKLLRSENRKSKNQTYKK